MTAAGSFTIIRPMRWIITVGIVLAGLVGCQAGSDAHSMSRTEVYFGRSRPGGANVSDAEFDRFVETEIATRFPSGFTLLPAQGHWREADGHVVTEPTVLLILFTDTRPDADKIEAICHAYRTRFGQEAVLKVTSRAEVEFETAATNSLSPDRRPED